MRTVIISCVVACAGNSTEELTGDTAAETPTSCQWPTPAPSEFDGEPQPIRDCAGGYPDEYRVEKNGTSDTLAIVITDFGWMWPAAPPPPRVDEAVSVRLLVEVTRPYVWQGGSLDVRRDAEWVVQVVDTEGRAVPFAEPLGVTLGAEAGAGRNGCGQWNYYDLAAGITA